MSRIEFDAPAPGRTITLLFSDVVGQEGEPSEDARRSHLRLVRQALGDAAPARVRNLGDGVLTTLPSVLDGLQAAVRVHRAANGLGASVRVALHVGAPIEDEGDYLSAPVVAARRLCRAATAGQILASDLVRGLVGGRRGFQFVDQ